MTTTEVNIIHELDIIHFIDTGMGVLGGYALHGLAHRIRARIDISIRA